MYNRTYYITLNSLAYTCSDITCQLSAFTLALVYFTPGTMRPIIRISSSYMLLCQFNPPIILAVGPAYRSGSHFAWHSRSIFYLALATCQLKLKS